MRSPWGLDKRQSGLTFSKSNQLNGVGHTWTFKEFQGMRGSLETETDFKGFSPGFK